MNTVNCSQIMPAWTTKSFVVFDQRDDWANSLSRELEATWKTRRHPAPGHSCPRVQFVDSGRAFLSVLKQRETVGGILFFDGRERDCLSILSRRLDSAQSKPVSAIIRDRHRLLIPVVLEADVSQIMTSPASVQPLADWCLSVINNAN